MNFEDPDASLESLLRSVPLREPDSDLDARVNATLASYRLRQPRRFQFYRMAIAAGILIALGIGVRLSLPKAHPVAVVTPAKPNPIRLERDTSTVYDDGMIAGTGDTAYQKLRRRTVREIWYIDPATHAEVLMTIPSEQVIIQKVEAF